MEKTKKKRSQNNIYEYNLKVQKSKYVKKDL